MHVLLASTSEHSPIKTGDWEMTYRILPIIKAMLAENLLSPDAIIDWGGGGEPTLMPDFDEAFALLDEHGTTQWLHSNAVRIPTRAKSGGMQKERVRILCSLDSGFASTYYEIKAKDFFDRVCQNLATYAANGAYVAVKYIMMEVNSSFEEIETCLQMMKSAGCAEFVPDINHDLPDPSEQVIRGLAFARLRCRQLGIPYQLGSTGINNAREYLVHQRVENAYYQLTMSAAEVKAELLQQL